MGAFLLASGRVRQERGEGLEVRRQVRQRVAYVVASRSVGRFAVVGYREKTTGWTWMAAGQRSTEGQGEECRVWQAGRLAGLNFAFLRAAQDSTAEFGPAQAVIEERSKTRTTKVRLSGLAGGRRGQRVCGKSGHISKSPSQPQAKRQSRALENAGAGAVAVAVGSAWQGQPRPTVQGPGHGRGRKSSSCQSLTCCTYLPSEAIGDQAGTARLGGESPKEVAGVPTGLFLQGSTTPFLLAFLASFLRRAYFPSQFGTSKYQAVCPAAIG